MDNFGTHIMITQAFYFIIHSIILVACIIIANKYKSIGGLLLVISAAFTLFIAIIRIFISNGIVSFDYSMINAQTILMYFNVFSYLMFSIGLLLFVINDLKEK
ncbi:hypothetical protein [Lacinutrix mariniflava]|uniref:hypothetical protein n=1 Tax=Lacinutrix mariniflava TaxID=342955 RepID=UPI0006E3714B|nr:hypothetical protein [Lacinutrix mariniflava]